MNESVGRGFNEGGYSAVVLYLYLHLIIIHPTRKWRYKSRKPFQATKRIPFSRLTMDRDSKMLPQGGLFPHCRREQRAPKVHR